MNLRSSHRLISPQSVYNPGFMVMYSNLSNCDWETTIKQDCVELLNQPVEEESKQSTSGVTLMSILVALILLSIATLYQLPRTLKSYQEFGQNLSIEFITLMRY